MLATSTPTEAGLLLSLAAALPNPASALARRARTVASRLQRSTVSRAVHREAADIVAALLDATDPEIALGAEEGLLDDDFDA